MKKAKIIIPSLSLLCFSAIACVTGTVAWFSSVSNAHVGTTNFAVKALEGSMEIQVLHGVGTKATLANASEEQKVKDGSGNVIGYQKSDNIVVVPDTYGTGGANTNILTHGSFDTANQTAYTVQDFSTTEFEAVTTSAISKANEDKFWCKGTEGVYHIFSFDIVFKYNFGGATKGKYNLFFDNDASSVTRAEGAIKENDTAKGFRMSFYNTTSKDWTAWSDLRDKSWGTDPVVNSHYIGKNSTVKAIDYSTGDTGNLIYKNDPIAGITGSTGSAARKDCLGTFDAETSVTSLTIRVVAWYEGEDPNIVSTADLSAVNVSLAFFLKGYAA